MVAYIVVLTMHGLTNITKNRFWSISELGKIFKNALKTCVLEFSFYLCSCLPLCRKVQLLPLVSFVSSVSDIKVMVKDSFYIFQVNVWDKSA